MAALATSAFFGANYVQPTHSGGGFRTHRIVSEYLGKRLIFDRHNHIPHAARLVDALLVESAHGLHGLGVG